jgi:hypothetical protein
LVDAGRWYWRTRPAIAPTKILSPRPLKAALWMGSGSRPACVCFHASTRGGSAQCMRTLPFHAHDRKSLLSTGWNATAMTLSSCLRSAWFSTELAQGQQ